MANVQSLGSYGRRVVHIAGIVARFGFEDVLQRLGLAGYLQRRRRSRLDAATAQLARPVRLRLALEEIGPAGIKIGQALSTRADLLSDEWIAELRKLQDEVPPFPFAAAQAVVEQELGGPLSQFFAEFDPVPVAAASLSQVHRAKRQDGRDVAVKVQRPEVRQQVEQDLFILNLAAREATHYIDWAKENDVVGWATEFGHILRGELDFTREAANTDRLRQDLADTPELTVPGVHWDLTAHRVLTLDFIEGVSPNDEQGLVRLGLDRVQVAREFALAMFRQVTGSGFFHGDPHAGNLKLLSDGRIALLDCGHVDYAGRELREQILAMMQSLLEGDSRGVVNVTVSVGVISSRTDLSALRLDVDKLIARFAPAGPGVFALAEVMDALLGLLVKHAIRVPATFASLVRAVVITQGVCFQLDPQFDAVGFLRQAVQEQLRQRFSPHRMFSVLQSSWREMAYLGRALPRQLSDLIMRTQAGGTRVRLEIEHIDRHMHRMDIMVNRLSFAIIVAAIIMASASILSSAQASQAIANPVALVFAAIAGFMGLWLIYSIIRSGRL